MRLRRLYDPKFTVHSRAGADRYAADLVGHVTRHPYDKAAILKDLRSMSKDMVRFAHGVLKGTPYALGALETARGYLIAARAVEKSIAGA